MGIFSRKKNTELPFAPFALKASYDEYNHYVIEAKMLGHMYGVDFDKAVGNQKVFAFKDAVSGCDSFIVIFADLLHILICKEEGQEFHSFQFEELSDIRSISDYDGSSSKYANETGQDDHEVRFWRTPRKVMEITANNLVFTFIANFHQIEFIEGYLWTKIKREERETIHALVKRSLEVFNGLNKSTFLREYKHPEEVGQLRISSPLLEVETSFQHIMNFAISKNDSEIVRFVFSCCILLNDDTQQESIERVLSLLYKLMDETRIIDSKFGEDREFLDSVVLLIYFTTEAVKAHPKCDDSIWEDFVSKFS
jgi:hypothetical protein